MKLIQTTATFTLGLVFSAFGEKTTYGEGSGKAGQLSKTTAALGGGL